MLKKISKTCSILKHNNFDMTYVKIENINET